MICFTGFRKGRQSGTITVLVVAAVLFSLVITNSKAQTPPKKIGVYIDKRDRQKMVGYTRIGMKWGLAPATPGEFLRAPLNFLTAMEYHTKIDSDIKDDIDLASDDLFNTSIVFLFPGENDVFTPEEIENMKKYVERGGFIFVDAPRPAAAPGEAIQVNPFRRMLNDVMPDSRFEPIPNSHEMYHCFFDFDDGPPFGSDTIAEKHDYLEGAYYNGRLATVLSEKGYAQIWNRIFSNETQLEFVVNLIVFSLTQEGGIASVY